jgi:hypothetical protein
MVLILVAVVAIGFVAEAVFDMAALDRRDLVVLRGIDLGNAIIAGVIFGQAFAGIVVAGFAVCILVRLVSGAQGGFFLGVGSLFGQQPLAVFARNLVIVGMDFAEGEEAVAIAAEIDESRLKRGFYPGNLGEIDIALDLLMIGRFKVEFLNTIALEHRHPGFFRVARIDQHARCHLIFSKRAAVRTSPLDGRPGRRREILQ